MISRFFKRNKKEEKKDERRVSFAENPSVLQIPCKQDKMKPLPIRKTKPSSTNFQSLTRAWFIQIKDQTEAIKRGINNQELANLILTFYFDFTIVIEKETEFYQLSYFYPDNLSLPGVVINFMHPVFSNELFRDFLNDNPTYRNLEFEGEFLTERHVTVLGRNLNINESIKKIHFRFLNLPSGVSTLFNQLLIKSSLEKISFCGCRGQFDDKSLAVLSKFLRTNNKLKALEIRYCGLQDEQWTASIAGNTTLETLDLYGNEISDVQTISRVLEKNSTLKHLYLGNNNLCDEAAVDLASSLSFNSSLKTLHLLLNTIGNAGAVALANMLITNQGLKHLVTTGNRIGEVGRTALLTKLYLTDVLQLNETPRRHNSILMSPSHDSTPGGFDAVKKSRKVRKKKKKQTRKPADVHLDLSEFLPHRDLVYAIDGKNNDSPSLSSASYSVNTDVSTPSISCISPFAREGSSSSRSQPLPSSEPFFNQNKENQSPLSAVRISAVMDSSDSFTDSSDRAKKGRNTSQESVSYTGSSDRSKKGRNISQESVSYTGSSDRVKTGSRESVSYTESVRDSMKRLPRGSVSFTDSLKRLSELRPSLTPKACLNDAEFFTDARESIDDNVELTVNDSDKVIIEKHSDDLMDLLLKSDEDIGKEIIT